MNNITNITQSHMISEDSSVGNLIGFGALFGVLHILTGPDHIAAIVTISANKGYKAFFVGAQWGIGDSAGLLIIFAILLTIDHAILDKTHIAEYVVGGFLVFLGFLGFYRTWKYAKNQKLLQYIEDEPLQIELEPNLSKWNYRKNNFLSLVAGILHGLAGPAGVLGVLPAVLIEDKGKSAAYLGTFCVTGVITMGTFAAFWGEISKRIEYKLGTLILGTSSMLSVIIGFLWIGLLATNQMDAIFE